MKKFKEFMHRLYWVSSASAFCNENTNLRVSAKGNDDLYKKRISLIESAIFPIVSSTYFFTRFNII